MPTTRTVAIYKFDELDDDAKEVARDWWRNGGLDYEWWDHIVDDAKRVGALIGFEIDKVYFSGFYSQGDGACFEGTYRYSSGWKAKLKAEIGGETLEEMLTLGEELQAIQRLCYYKLEASSRHSGFYYHERSMDISLDMSECPESSYADQEPYEEIRDAFASFAQWIYSSLEAEYEWLNSDEQVDESIRTSDYEFYENGEIA